MYRDRQQGVALVITLIFLSVITVMAVALLAVANRGRSASRESSNRVVAQQIVEIGQERAQSEIMARALGSFDRDVMGPELTVSQNYRITNANNLNRLFYGDADWKGDFSQDPSVYDILDDSDLQANLDAIAELQYDPRPPVFVGPDRALPGETNGFRFFLDLNRNGLFEDTGYLRPVDQNGNFMFYDNGDPVFEYLVGDPQWIGVLRDPSRPHSADNPFIGRYAYVIQPAGRSLDINQIHNDAKQIALAGYHNGFRRNEGVGPWEINLAAFLADLNTNVWFYGGYDPDVTQFSGNLNDFDDAFWNASLLLNRRYLPNVTFLQNYTNLFPFGNGVFQYDGIDGYAIGNIPLRGFPEFRTNDFDAVDFAWIGAPNNTNFYSVHDYFKGQDDPNYQDFTGQLALASTNVSSYDRYTYYRMISQLGSDSAPVVEDKINLNYLNQPAGYFITQRTNDTVVPFEPFVHSPTNYLEWTPMEFFNTTVDRLMRDEFRDTFHAAVWTNRSLSIWEQGGIPVHVNGISVFTNANGQLERYYSRRVHQLLQVAANICDATIGTLEGEAYPYFPNVFRPYFYETNVLGMNMLCIAGYERVNSAALHFDLLRTVPTNRWHELSERTGGTGLSGFYQGATNFYEIPMIVGARKGFPTFNEFAAQTVVQATRKIEVRRQTLSGPNTETNMMFIMGISNNFGIEAWFPYTNGVYSEYVNPTGGIRSNYYPRPLEMYAAYSTTATLLDSLNPMPRVSVQGTNYSQIIPANTWGGAQQVSDTNHFRLIPVDSQVVLEESVFYVDPPFYEPVAQTNRFEKNIAVFNRNIGLAITNRLLYFLFDIDPLYGTNLVDVVSLNGLGMAFNVSDQLNDTTGETQNLQDLWSIEPWRNINEGVREQILISSGLRTVDETVWRNYGGFDPATGNTVNDAIAGFRRFLGLPEDARWPTNDLPEITLTHQAPFVPMKKMLLQSTWQADDPMVHYTVDDLTFSGSAAAPQTVFPPDTDDVSLTRIGNMAKENDRYSPWAGKNNADFSVRPAPSLIDPMARDAGLWNPDHFEFPTNKFPNVGWLGRVHRGTPWQTINLKATSADREAWWENRSLRNRGSLDPIQDWRLVDHFTTSLSPEVSRGRMSINQTNRAAWSAVLSGVPVTALGEFATGSLFADDFLVEPAANDPAVAIMAEDILFTKTNRTFTSLGEILAVPSLTMESPFLNPGNISLAAMESSYRLMRDTDYERVPQQILSLLKVGEPRFVVYTFAQTLAPEELNTSGTYFKMPLNYRVTSETATRTVMSLEYDRISEDPTRTDNNPFDPRYNEPDFDRPRVVVESYNLLPLE